MGSHSTVTTGLMHPGRTDAAACDEGASPAPVATGAAPLGIYGKSSPASQAVRRENYALQSAARKLRRGLPVARCLRWAVPKRHISIMHSTEFGRAFYAGLETCGSVWECPVCASKISERRRAETLAAMTAWRCSGGQVLLLTLTSPHYFGDNLRSLLEGQAQALRRFTSTREAKRLFEDIGLEGMIRALEVTYGKNGWHPHHHALLFVPSGLDLDRVRRQFYSLWSNACRLAGLPAPSFTHGVTLQDGTHADRYVSKWGLENEVTKGHIKKGKQGGRTPFDLLRDYRNGDKQSGALYVEYANAFKGKRQLVWSKGLKARFAIADLNDEELSARADEDAQHGHELERDDWKLILSNDIRAEILEAFENGGAFEVGHVLAWYRQDVSSSCDSSDDDRLLRLLALADELGWSLDRLVEFVRWQESEASCSSLP